MSSADSHALPAPAEETRLAPKHLAGLVVAGVALLVAAWLLDAVAPLVAAAFVAAIMPARHGWKVRAALGVIAAVLVLFVIRCWPTAAADEAPVPAPSGESRSLLSWLIGLPLGGAVFILFMPRQAHRLLQWTTMLLMFGTLAASVPLLATPMGRWFHYDQDVAWLPRFGIHYHVAIDGISLWLVLLTTFIMPITAYVSFGSIKTRIKDWCFSLLLLEGAMIGAFLAMDLFLFYVFWELMLIPMYVMIGVWGGASRIKAAIKFFLYTMFGSVLMLAAILYVAYEYSKVTGQLSFDYFELQRMVLPFNKDPNAVFATGPQFWVWLAFTLSFAIKVPMFPVHTWLPDAHTEAPTGGSIVLAAVMLKLGTYGYLRFSQGLFPEASGYYAANLAGVAVLGGIIYGAFCAWKQTDFKRLVAYSSVAHLGYVMLGIFAMTSASIEGSVLQMVNHGISTGALFLLVGVVYDRRHTRMVSEFGGLAKPMPVYATMFIIATLASIGLPATNGFIGEFMVITGTFASTRLGHFNGVQAVGAAIGVILGALYMLSVVQKVFFGPITKKENRRLPDINGRELLAVAPLVAMIFIIGLFPNIFLSQIRDAGARVRDDFNARVGSGQQPAFFHDAVSMVARRPEAPPTGDATTQAQAAPAGAQETK
jgi:NADH-quinone oxidoreductase subunit M